MMISNPAGPRKVRIILLVSIIVFIASCLNFEPERIFMVETSWVNEITDASCIVSGVIIDLGEESINQHGFCYSTTPDPSIGKNDGIISLGSINSVGEYSTVITDLSPETSYYVRAYISNGDSSTYGKILNFTTDIKATGTKPTVTTTSAIYIQETSATIGGNVTDDGGASVSERGIYYSTSSDPSENGTKVSLGDGLGIFTTTLSGLANNTEYFFIAFATNSNGTSFGVVKSFITSNTEKEKLTVNTTTATDIQETSATVGGEVTKDGGEDVTERGIYYSTSSDPDKSGTKVSLGDGLGAFSTTLSGLDSSTEYFYTAFATNSKGTQYGAILSFTTGISIVKPSVTTLDASQISETSASIGGNVTKEGGAPVTEKGIFYGTGSDPLSSGTKIAVGSGIGTFSTTLSELVDGTRYYYVAYATNNAGTSYGTTLSFTTSQTVVKPSVMTTSATSITETTAIVGGNVSDNGGGTVTERGIYYGTSSDPLATGVKLDIGNGLGPFSTTLSDLIDGTRYYYVAYATNSAGTSFGTTLSFNTTQTVVKPSVTTTTATSITETTAIVGGDVSDSGGGTVTEHGIYYGTSSDPVTTGTKVTIGSGIGAFSTTLSGLIDGTEYYFVAYATNSAGTSYGVTLSFATLQIIVKPTVTTSSASAITETTAVVGGNVTNSGGGIVTERGIYYGTSSNPVTTGTKVQIGSGTGTFSKTQSGLADGTKYYFVAFASNSAGMSFGNTLIFNTITSTVTDFDGNEYQTVKIGTQTWMAENLKTTRYADGSSIQLETSSSAWRALDYTEGAYCYYDNNSTYGVVYGALYNWAAATNGEGSSEAIPSGIQGVCPAGWHLPSDGEWKQMEMFLGMSQAQADLLSLRGTNEGNKLKDSGYTHWNSPNEGTNSSGFKALGAGTRDYFDESFWNLKGEGFFWSSTQKDSDYSYVRGLYHDSAKAGRYSSIKGNGFSVRCIKD